MAQFTPIRGFVNTPVSKSICIIFTIAAVMVSILEIKYFFNLQVDPFILEYSQYWRIAIYQLTVVNESDYLICILLWFLYKNLERFYGSRIYLSLVTVLALYNALCCFIVMSVGQLITRLISYALYAKLGWISEVEAFDQMIFNKVIPGPLGIISSLYICYGKVIPVSYRFNIVLSAPTPPSLPEDDNSNEFELESEDLTKNTSSRELTLTNHLQIHILYTLLILNNGYLSIIPCLVGLFLGNLHVNELLPGAKWTLPNSVYRAFVHPVQTISKLGGLFDRNVNDGYERLSRSNDSLVDDGQDQESEDQANTGEHVIRAETPVRPLGSQFFDTFRT